MTQATKLDRTLGLWSVVLFGLAYMTPMIVFGTFGPLAAASQGTTAMAYFIAALAIFLTAASYGIMAKVYPVAGSAYTYSRKSLSSGAGFLVGWTVLLDYFFLPMVIWLTVVRPMTLSSSGASIAMRGSLAAALTSASSERLMPGAMMPPA